MMTGLSLYTMAGKLGISFGVTTQLESILAKKTLSSPCIDFVSAPLSATAQYKSYGDFRPNSAALWTKMSLTFDTLRLHSVHRFGSAQYKCLTKKDPPCIFRYAGAFFCLKSTPGE